MIHHAQRFRRGTGVSPVDDAQHRRSMGVSPAPQLTLAVRGWAIQRQP
jgi:hypothetical protein